MVEAQTDDILVRWYGEESSEIILAKDLKAFDIVTLAQLPESIWKKQDNEGASTYIFHIVKKVVVVTTDVVEVYGFGSITSTYTGAVAVRNDRQKP